MLESAQAGESVVLDGLGAVTVPLATELSVDIEVPDQPFLEFSISVRPPAEPPRGVVRFAVHLDAGGEETPVFQEDVRVRSGTAWRARRINLAAWSGERVRLRFVAEPGDPGRFPGDCRVAWGNPTIATSGFRADGSRPSIVVLLVDTLRRDYLGLYGFHGSISPNLDWLARESAVIDNAYSQAPWTKPSVASLFTSMYPDVHGLDNHEGLFGRRAADALTTGVLPSQAVTMAEAFRDAGYRTAAFVANPWLDPHYGFDQGFDLYRIEPKMESILGGARKWIRGEASAGRPFFLYLHFMDVHGPYDAPEEDFEAMMPSQSLDVFERPPLAALTSLPPYLRTIPWFSNEDLETGGGARAASGFGGLVDFRLQHSRTLRARYAANVRDFDRRIAPFLNELRSSEWNERTIVVLTSDHGEELLEHGGWDHGFTLYDDQIRVPLLIRLPRAKGARRLSSPMNLIDLMPTLLAMAGVKAPPGAEGRDLSPRLLAGVEVGSDDSHNGPPSFTTISMATKHREGVYAVRTERYKLILDSESGVASLFDLATDPGEYRDLSSTDEARVRGLERLLSRHLADARTRALSPELTSIPDALQKRLESLGYLKR